VLLAAAGAAFTWATLVLLNGGASFLVGDVLVRSRHPWTALAIGVLCAAAALAASGAHGVRTSLESAWTSRARSGPWIAGFAACTAAGVGIAWGTSAASGADAYGYVSQALLWVSGHLTLPQPLAIAAPWPSPEWTLSPLGWRPAVSPGAIVPTYAPGLPLIMAVSARLAGTQAVFWVVPIAGACAVWLTWRLGIRLTDPGAAATAAVLMACSPVFLLQVVQPMSDVPVTAWWTGALALVLARRPALAGVCASAAILTRPNLAPLAGWLAAGSLAEWGATRRPWSAKLQGAAAFAATTTPGVALWLLLNQAWYGHPLSSGYGTSSDLFAAANILPNLDHYARWMAHVHTPCVALAFVAPALAWWTGRRFKAALPAGRSAAPAGRPMVSGPSPASGSPVATTTRPSWRRGPVTRRPGGPAIQGFTLGFACLVILAYLPYAVFEGWGYVRFLLPGLPVLLILMCDVGFRAVARVPAAAAIPLVVVGLAAAGSYQLAVARSGNAFDLKRLEARYVEAGRFAAEHLPPNAVLFAVQQSGSLRYYSARPTVRWDMLDAAWLDRAVEHLRRRGNVPYFVLEDWEETQFRDRFSHVSVLGRLDWLPAVELRQLVRVRFYDPRDRPLTPPSSGPRRE
jgi:hypothetical protein